MFFGVSHIANEKMRLKLNVAFSYVVRDRFGQMKNENICIFVFQLYAVNSYSCRVLTQHLIDNFVTHLTLLISSFCFCFVLFKWVCVGFALYLSKNFLQVKNDPQLNKNVVLKVCRNLRAIRFLSNLISYRSYRIVFMSVWPSIKMLVGFS